MTAPVADTPDGAADLPPLGELKRHLTGLIEQIDAKTERSPTALALRATAMAALTRVAVLDQKSRRYGSRVSHGFDLVDSPNR
jgi:hypothetical protein